MVKITEKKEANKEEHKVMDEFFDSLKGVKVVWNCNSHESCKTCKYFYYSCSGFTNSSDERNKQIPYNEQQFIDIIWRGMSAGKIDPHAKHYLFWLRLKDIGVELRNLNDVRALEPEDIEKLIEVYFLNKKLNEGIEIEEKEN